LGGRCVYIGVTTDGAQLLEALPGDLAGCHALIGQLLDALGNANRKMTRMEHQLQQLLRRLYGRSSERIDPKQMALFAEMLRELEAQNPSLPEPEPASATTTPRNGHGRRRLPADLPRERIIHDLPDDEKPCPCCGEMRTLIGEETSEQLDYVPAQVKVIEHVRLKYVCKPCETAAAEDGPQIQTAAKPLSPIEKGLAAPGLLSYVIVSKYGDHLPLHRLEKILKRHDIEIGRSTMCDWMRQSAEALTPLHDLMVREVLAGKVIHTDDTPVDVLEPKGRGTKTGRFWVYHGDPSHPQTVFDYTPSRKRDGPVAFLDGWGKDETRYLQADAFGGYDGIYAGDAGGHVVEVACWAHARRKFHEARKSDHRHSAQALAYIRLLYDVESEAQQQLRDERKADETMTDQDAHRRLTEIRLELRRERSVPRLAEFKTWLDGLQATAGGPVLPKSPMGQAITYALNQWDALCVYAGDGDLNIDNNPAENALRRIALGRKNWLFAGSDTGGRTAAILFSLIATCQRHHVEPFAYLRDVLTRIAAHSAHRLDELLPGNWKPAENA
jgi:transposase